MNTAIKGFKATGIWPPNLATFSDSYFLTADATNIKSAGNKWENLSLTYLLIKKIPTLVVIGVKVL